MKDLIVQTFEDKVNFREKYHIDEIEYDDIFND